MGNKIKIPELRFKEFTDEWKEKHLGEISDITTGNKDTQDKIDNGLYPFFVRSDNVEKINTFSYDGEAILTSGDGVGVGKNFHYIIGKFDYHQRVYCICNFSSGVYGKYLYFHFSTSFYKRVIKLSAKNSVDSVRRSMVTDMLIPLPSLSEQTKIADFLSKVDEKIEKTQKKKELWQKYQKGIMQQLFSQELRFKDDNGNDYPDWEEKKLSDVFKRITRKNSEHNTNVLTISAQQGLVNQQTFFNKSVAGKNLTTYYLLYKGDFAYNKSYSKGYPMGAIKRLNLYERGIVSTLYICFENTNKDADSIYFEQFFETGILNQEIEKIAQEGARNHGLLNISVTDFFSIPMLMPSLSEQKKIAFFLTAIDRKIELIEKELTGLKEFKKALLQQMFV